MSATVELPTSLAERYAVSTVRQRERALRSLEIERQLELAGAQATGRLPWWFEGRADQFEPPGDWRWWVINAGRGWGKTRTGAEWVLTKLRRYRNSRSAFIAPTFTDGRDTMVEGVSGVLSCLSPTELRGGSIETGWNRSTGELFFHNGARGKVFSSEQSFRLRGPNHHFVWGDEPSYWRDVDRGTARDSTWSNANIGLRLPPRRGWDAEYRPMGLLTMTPRLVPLLKVPDEVVAVYPEQAGILQRNDITLTQGATLANLRNLDQTYFEAVIRPLLGTTLGVQELGGVLLEHAEGALWTPGMIERDRITPDALPAPRDLTGTAVAFDPSGATGRAEHGVVVVSATGYDNDREWYVRADVSHIGSPDSAAETVILAALIYGADAIVYEKNQGQDWIPSVINARWATMQRELALGHREDDETQPPVLVDFPDAELPPLQSVDAIKNKLQRATPTRGLYEQHRVHHVGRFGALETQLTTWVPGESDSPDRLDALVWGVEWLRGSGPSTANVMSPAARARQRARRGQPQQGARLPRTLPTTTQRRH